MPPPGVKLYARLKGLGAKARRSTFDQWDVNGNGGLSLAEIDKAMVGSVLSFARAVLSFPVGDGRWYNFISSGRYRPSLIPFLGLTRAVSGQCY